MSVIPHKKGLKFEGFDITATKFVVFSPSISEKKIKKNTARIIFWVSGEASLHDQIKMTELWLEYDQKISTPININNNEFIREALVTISNLNNIALDNYCSTLMKVRTEQADLTSIKPYKEHFSSLTLKAYFTNNGFYPLYLCQAEVCPSDAERQKWKLNWKSNRDGYIDRVPYFH